MRRWPLGLAAAALAVAAVSSVPASFAETSSALIPPGHVPEPDGFHKGAMHGHTPNTIKGGTVLDAKALDALIAKDKPLLLDVADKDRKPDDMAPGMIWSPTHSSIPGAVYLQGGGKGTDEKAYVGAFETRLAALTGGDMGKPIVTFCHPHCWASYNAAKRLVGLGYTRVYWYRDGVEGWQAAHPTRVVKPDSAWVASIPKDLTQ